MTVFYVWIRLVNCNSSLRHEKPSTALEETEELVLTTKCIYDKCQPPNGRPNDVRFYKFLRVATSCCRKKGLTHGSTDYA